MHYPFNLKYGGNNQQKYEYSLIASMEFIHSRLNTFFESFNLTRS